MTAPVWRPASGPETAQLRARLLAAARTFMAVRGVLEVDTPVLVPDTVSDPATPSIAVDAVGGWLRTSPEYHMKRLLAAGYPDIYQVGKVFRAGESGSRHQPEFTLIEWYRLGFGLEEMIDECAALVRTLLGIDGKPTPQLERIAYREAFGATLGLDPFTATHAELEAAAGTTPGWHADLAAQLGEDRHAWLDYLAGERVYPGLGRGVLWAVFDYPAEQAMLARLRPNDRECALRFELMLDGLELANGFVELADAAEQRTRFAQDNARRARLGLPQVDPDEALLAALDAGLPDCAGVAVGLERLCMLATGADRIDDAVTFAPGR